MLIRKHKTLGQRGVADMAILLVVVVLVVAGVGGYVFKKKSDENKAQAKVLQEKKAAEDKIKAVEDKRIGEIKAKLKLSAAPYVDEENGLEVYYPEGWTIDNSGAGGTLVTFVNPSKDKDADGNEFNASVNVILEETTVDQSTYISASKKQLEKALTGYKSVEDREITADNDVKVHILGSTFNQGKVKVRLLQGIAVQQGYAGIVTAGALDRDWAAYKDIFEQIMIK